MAKKGTGWIPDFPNVKDYTLKGKQIELLVGQLQKDKSTASHEAITDQLAQAVRLLMSQSKTLSGADENDQSKGLARELNNLIGNLDKKATGGLFFADIKIHKILSQGMSDPEVLRVKRYLKSLYDDFLSPRTFDVFNPTFDTLTKDLIQDFQQNRGLPADGQVNITTMAALWWADTVKSSSGLYDYYHYCRHEDIEQIQATVERLKNLQKRLQQDTSSLTEAENESLLREATEQLEHSRNIVKEALNDNHVALSPLVEVWLNDAREKHIKAELEALIEQSTQRQADSEFPDFTSSLIGLQVDALLLIKTLINRIINIPGTLPVPAPFRNDDSTIEKLDPLLPGQVFDSVFRNLFSGEAAAQLLQLMQPLTRLEFSVVSSDTDLNSYDASSYVFKQRERAAQRVNSQLDILGFSAPDQYFSAGGSQEEAWNEAYARIDEFEHDNAQLKAMINELFQEKTGMHRDHINSHEVNNIYLNYRYTLLFEQIAIEVQEKVYSFVLPIARAVLEIISPLGRHTNLERSVREGLEVFWGLLRQSVESEGPSPAIPVGSKNSRLPKSSQLDHYEHLRRISLLAIRSIFYRLSAESRSLLTEFMANAIAPHITQDKLSELDPETIGKLGETFRAKPLLELVDPENGRHDPVDLKIPIDWASYQNLIQRSKPNPEASEATMAGATESGNANQKPMQRIYLELPDFVDLSFWCSPVADQGSIDACTAHAGVALVEYFAKKTFGKFTAASRLFLYKTTRNLMRRLGDSGTSVRETMKAMVLFGIPPEEHWPYDEAKYDQEPTTFCYSFAGNYKALKYFRLDYAGISLDALLIQVKAVLAAGFPCMFGFTIYTSIHDESNTENGYIPIPSKFDKLEGGHAAVAIGYDDSRLIENADGTRSQGAILVRNSWGTAWGQGGYGWLPYDYVLSGLTADWWSLFQTQWFESGQFGVGASHWLTHMGGNRGRL
ncbi:peptidoglycan-binding protein [Nodosilinea sp. P-1105]|uniref:peptidoglycan-binding protein n=1 Tax=Nodosilinea sp. P-1105 TaxID=2546229 RepID=UPI00146C85D5|nr:peptidoglycan-binding protein [Nodosilinea sp. P-1105]NMF83242.1 hypothetical protein [Nodosilinea sp. P-1105]